MPIGMTEKAAAAPVEKIERRFMVDVMLMLDVGLEDARIGVVSCRAAAALEHAMITRVDAFTLMTCWLQE